MADYSSKPIPKRRSSKSSDGGGANKSTSTTFSGLSQQMYMSSKNMYDTSPEGSFADTTGLPGCVQHRNQSVTEEQKVKDSQLPKLLYNLDEACMHGASDEEKERLAWFIVNSASSPIRKYRLLQFFKLLDNNKDETSVQKIPDALQILEKYATNLLKEEKHSQWKIIKFHLSIIQDQVFPVQGAKDVLVQMGYSEVTDKAFIFPSHVEQADTQTVVVLASDIIIARVEMNVLLNNRHPFLIFRSTPAVSGIGKTSVAGKVGKGMDGVLSFEGGLCGVCSKPDVSKLCKECEMQFCDMCDERWHSHKLRLSHFRHNLKNPAYKEKSEIDRSRPVPLPRQWKVQTPDNTPVFSQAPILTQPGKISPVVSPYSDLSYTTSSINQEIRHPPPRTSTRPSPGMVSPLNTSQSPLKTSQSPQSNFSFSPPFSTGSTTLGKTQMNIMTFQQSQIQAGHIRDDRSRQNEVTQHNISPVAAGNETVYSCPSCSLLVSSSLSFCPSCNCQLLKTPAKNTSSYGMPPIMPSQGREGSNLLRVSQDLGQLRGTSHDVSSHLKEQSLARRKLPDIPGVKVTTSSAALANSTMVEQLYEELIPMQGEQSKDVWSCEHCTFLNPFTTQVCQLCCKTPSDLKNHTSVTGKVPQSGSSNSAGQVSLPNEGKMNGGIDPEITAGLYASIKHTPSEAVYMTPKNLPLDGGIYMVPKDVTKNPPPLPPKSNQVGTRVHDAQISREQELSEKQKGKKSEEEKLRLFEIGLITEDQYYNPHFEIAQFNERQLNHGTSVEQQNQFPQENVHGNVVRQRAGNTNMEEMRLSDEELLRLLGDNVFPQEDIPKDSSAPAYFQPQRQTEPTAMPRQGSKLSREELMGLYEAGIIGLDVLRAGSQDLSNQMPQEYQIPKIEQRPGQAPQDDIKAMFEEFQRLHVDKQSPLNYQDVGFKNTGFDFHVIRKTHSAPAVPNMYDKIFAKNPGVSIAPQGNSNFMSLPSYLVDHLGTYNYIEGQSRQYVEWMKEAESADFTPEELNLATNLSWRDPQGRDPVKWLKEEWTDRLVEVIRKVTEMTNDENDRVGNLSMEEAKQSLLENDGSVQSACKSCIESRREKLTTMCEIAIFGRIDCMNALDNNNGDMDKAVLELDRKALEPMRKRNIGKVEDGMDGGERNNEGDEKLRKFIAMVTNKNVTFERRVRVVFAEKHGKHVTSWGRAETVVKLIDMDFSVEDSIEAASAFGDFKRSLVYLQQECPVCLDVKPMSQMITFLCCQDRICKECVTEHLTMLIKEKNIHNIVCPVCGLPDLCDEAEATEYFNNLDIMMRQIVEKDVHDLFQQKLRDRTLRKEPNFRWCAHCSYGFINEQPNINKMMCPNCRKHTCFSCKKQWAAQHEGITCERFALWQEQNDEEFQMAGLAGHLARHGIDCPECKYRYDLAKGGCMHFKCVQCSHEFCSGCYNPFKHGAKCTVSAACGRKGIHAHHPRDCLFYLRDWTPQRLRGLLDEYGVDYNVEPAVVGPQEEGEDVGEVIGAVGGGVALCEVMEQKDTPNGLDDAPCGMPCEDGHAGLCKVHYTEYLVSLIKRSGIDPADVMNVDEIITVLRRAEIEPAAKERGEDNDLYKERILNILRERLPLRRPDEVVEELLEVDLEDGELEELLV